MTMNTSIRTWFGFEEGATLRAYVRGKEHALFLVGAAVIFIHLLTQAFIDPESMSSASDNFVTGVGGPTLVALIAHGSRLGFGRLQRWCLDSLR